MLRNTSPRALLWTALAAVALLAGAAVAQSGAETHTRADTTADETKARPYADEAKPGYQVKATPEKLLLKAGGRETIRLYARAAEDTLLQVRVAEEPRGILVRMGATEMKTGDAPMEIGVYAAPNATPGERVLRIGTTTDAGERQETRVVIHVMGALPLRAASTVVDAAKPTAVRPAAASNAPTAAASILRVDPEAQRAKGGETLTYALVLSSPRNMTYDLSLAEMPAGYRATLSPESLQVDAGERAKAVLTVTVPGNASSATFVAYAKAREGDLRGMAKARVEIAPKPIPAPRDERPAEDDAERYPMAREAPMDKGGLGFRAMLYPRDAVVGPEGGRALVLLSGGPRDVTVKLDVRQDEASGWRIHVREAVKLPAHGQAWAWVVLEPASPDAGPVKYDLVASGPGGRVALPGTVQVENGHVD